MKKSYLHVHLHLKLLYKNKVTSLELSNASHEGRLAKSLSLSDEKLHHVRVTVSAQDLFHEISFTCQVISIVERLHGFASK